MGKPRLQRDWKKARGWYESGLTLAEIARRFKASVSAVWHNLRRVGTETRRQGRTTRFTDEQATDAYERAGTLRKAARELGCHLTTVRTHVIRAGVSINPRPLVKPERDAEIFRLRGEGKTMREIGRLLGISKQRVGQICQKGKDNDQSTHVLMV